MRMHFNHTDGTWFRSLARFWGSTPKTRNGAHAILASSIAAAFALTGGLFCAPASAYQGIKTPKLHVTGRFLQDPNGNNVTLHGYMQPGGGWFNGEGHIFNNPTDYVDPSHVDTCLKYYEGVADILSDNRPMYGKDHGWYCSFVRYIGDTGGVGNFAPGWDADGNLAHPEQFEGWLKNVIVPYVEHCKKDGLYVVLVGNPSEVFPKKKDGKDDAEKNMSKQYQDNLISFWSKVASYKGIKNADNVMFEICNEPIAIETSFGKGDWGSGNDEHWASITSFMQPVVDAIRAQKSNNVIWIPGLGWQGEYAGFAKYPVNGKNIGYAIHIYPAYGGAHNNPDLVVQNWNRQYKPAGDLYTLIVTEMAWSPNNGWGYQDLFNGRTDGFGNAIRKCIDDEGNVSFVQGMVGDLLGNLKDGLAYTTLGSEDSTQAAFDWFKDYDSQLPRGKEKK